MECPLGSVRICRQLNELAVNSDEINLFEAASPTARGIAAPGSSPGQTWTVPRGFIISGAMHRRTGRSGARAMPLKRFTESQLNLKQ